MEVIIGYLILFGLFQVAVCDEQNGEGYCKLQFTEKNWEALNQCFKKLNPGTQKTPQPQSISTTTPATSILDKETSSAASDTSMMSMTTAILKGIINYIVITFNTERY